MGFFETVVDGEMMSGDLFQTTANWYNYNKERENSLILVYEDMKKDLNGNLKKLSDFLGKKSFERGSTKNCRENYI